MSDQLYAKGRLIPLWVKIVYTGFIAVVVPIYLKRYGATNFLYFCNLAFFATLIGVWLESPVFLSAALIGIFVPQMLWVADFFCELAVVLGWSSFHLTAQTEYMFRPPWFLRFLSFYHFWLPFFLIYLVWCVGYDRRGILVWTAFAWVTLTICYAFMPEPTPFKDASGQLVRDPDKPANINYVFGLTGDEEKQKWVEDEDAYFALYMASLVVFIFLPTHLLCWWLMPGPRKAAPASEYYTPRAQE